MTRALRAVAIVIAVAAAAWLCGEAAPGTPGERAAKASGLLPADDSAVPPATRAAIIADAERAHGLDRSGPRRLAGFVRGLAVLDLGRSWRDGSSVRVRVGRALGRTLTLVLAALVVALAIGIGAGIVAAEQPGARADVVVSGIAAVAVAVPTAWIGLVALRAFAYGAPFQWLPTGGLDSLGAAVLPVVTLAVVPGSVLARYARAALIAATAEPWAIAARARGASTGHVVRVHALRASAAGLAAVAETLVAYLLGATLVVERVFDIRGLGNLVVDASARGDVPVVVGATIASGFVLALASLASDAAKRAFDPRLRDRQDGAGAA